jgi:hypothetical protein
MVSEGRSMKHPALQVVLEQLKELQADISACHEEIRA